MKNYYPTREEVDIQIIMLNLGFKVYPRVQKKGVRWSLVILVYEYRGVPHESSEPPFAQAYLTYKNLE